VNKYDVEPEQGSEKPWSVQVIVPDPDDFVGTPDLEYIVTVPDGPTFGKARIPL
jgi:hypothetical protein